MSHGLQQSQQGYGAREKNPLVADELQVPIDDVQVIYGDTALTPHGVEGPPGAAPSPVGGGGLPAGGPQGRGQGPHDPGAAAQGIDVNEDLFASADYRRHLAQVFTDGLCWWRRSGQR